MNFTAAVPIHVDSFATENNYDSLIVNCESFSGKAGLNRASALSLNPFGSTKFRHHFFPFCSEGNMCLIKQQSLQHSKGLFPFTFF